MSSQCTSTERWTCLSLEADATVSLAGKRLRGPGVDWAFWFLLFEISSPILLSPPLCCALSFSCRQGLEVSGSLTVSKVKSESCREFTAVLRWGGCDCSSIPAPESSPFSYHAFLFATFIKQWERLLQPLVSSLTPLPKSPESPGESDDALDPSEHKMEEFVKSSARNAHFFVSSG